jgi:hypothetical protein
MRSHFPSLNILVVLRATPFILLVPELWWSVSHSLAIDMVMWPVICWQMFNNQFSKGKYPWSVTFANFHSVNNLTVWLISSYQGEITKCSTGKKGKEAGLGREGSSPATGGSSTADPLELSWAVMRGGALHSPNSGLPLDVTLPGRGHGLGWRSWWLRDLCWQHSQRFGQ